MNVAILLLKVISTEKQKNAKNFLACQKGYLRLICIKFISASTGVVNYAPRPPSLL